MSFRSKRASLGKTSAPLSTPRAAGAAAFWPLWFAAVLLPLSMAAAGSWWTWSTVEAEARSRLARTVDMLHEHALRALETQEALLTAAQRHTAAMTWAEIAASHEVAEFLRDLANSAAWVSSIGMVAPDGRLVQITTAPFPPPDIEVGERDYVRAHQEAGAEAGRQFVGEAIISRAGGRAVVPVSRARLGDDGQPDGGVLWATFRPADFAAFYAAVAEAPGDAVALLRHDGAVLARYPVPDPPVGQHVPLDAPSMRAARDAIQAGGRVAFVAGHSSLEPGEQRLYAARPLGGYPVSIIYGLHRDVARSEWLRQTAVLGAVAAAAAALLLWLTWLVQDRARRERDALALARAAAERRAEAESALRQGERLELLGQLAAGVAHDFRNVVQAVQSGADLIRRQAQDESVRDLARMIEQAAERGGALTKRMLNFARRGATGTGAPVAPIDPAAVLEGTAKLLGKTVGPHTRIRLAVGVPRPPKVMVDEGELEAAVINLAINARDALPPEGGEVVIALAGEAVALGEEHPGGLGPGAYARISVRDTGVGMDAATLARASEPFFTTKPPGQGTGLGLASVRACTESAGGALHIESEPGRGTTVTLWLPADKPRGREG